MSENFDIKSTIFKLEKKILTSMATKSIITALSSETETKFLKSLYGLIKMDTSKKRAEKLIRNIIKISLKYTLIVRNGGSNVNKFNTQELENIEMLQDRFNRLILTLLTYSSIPYTYDERYLIKELKDTENVLLFIIERHVTKKTISRIQDTFNYFTSSQFFYKLYRTTDKEIQEDVKYQNYVNKLVDSMNHMMDS
ncbi:hypothetical protein A3Q56_04715 [Intoshia linei]|uniref:Tumor necrosis factor alpha-induced protein 8 n=1 Tax=Intoshia linei TaxID=1819745 RepID=A0A177AZX0_9BILA|nr:hypothetical protein A3Q56_04715 [Intoshia linei]